MENKEKNLQILKEKIAISNLLEEEQMGKKNKISNIVKPMVAVCMMCVSLTGMVFAKDISAKIYEDYFGTGRGMGAAVENGYIEKTSINDTTSKSSAENIFNGKKVKDVDTKIKIDEFVMDDVNLSITFDVTLSDDIGEVIIPEEVKDMDFPDIIIYDENYNVLLGGHGADLKEFAKIKNLDVEDYNVSLENSKVVNSGVNAYICKKNGKNIKMQYNIYTGGDFFPKSKKINVYMNEIKLSDNAEIMQGDEEVLLQGNWEFGVDVPEKMYNRQNIVYKQKSTTNDESKVMTAILYNTGMELEFQFEAEKQMSWTDIESQVSEELAFFHSLDKNDELRTIDILNYLETKIRNNSEYQELMKRETDKWHFESKLINSKGQEFSPSVGPRENGSAHIDDNGIMTSTTMYDLTQFDATDEITLHIDYKGRTSDIVLEKIKE